MALQFEKNSGRFIKRLAAGGAIDAMVTPDGETFMMATGEIDSGLEIRTTTTTTTGQVIKYPGKVNTVIIDSENILIKWPE